MLVLSTILRVPFFIKPRISSSHTSVKRLLPSGMNPLAILFSSVMAFSELEFFVPPELVAGATCSADDGLIRSLTQENRNSLRSCSIWTTTVPPSMWMKLKGASHRLDLVRITSTKLLSGSLRSLQNCSMPFVLFVCQTPNATLFRNCSFATSSMAIWIILDLSNCDGAEMIRAGLGMAPKTENEVQRPSIPTLQLTAETESYKHSFPLVWRFLSAQICWYANR